MVKAERYVNWPKGTPLGVEIDISQFSLAPHEVKQLLVENAMHSLGNAAMDADMHLLDSMEHFGNIKKQGDKRYKRTSTSMAVTRYAVKEIIEHYQRLKTIDQLPNAADCTDVDSDFVRTIIHGLHKVGNRRGVFVAHTKNLDMMPTLGTSAPIFDLVITNLVQNGIKYAHPERRYKKKDQSYVIFSYLEECSDGQQQYSRFYCSDNATGIPEEKWGHIFENGSRLNSEVAHGSGKGLHLVACGLNYVGGRIFMKSERDKGTTFDVLLPHQTGYQE